MTYYAGIDLHSDNSYLATLDESEKVIYKKRLPNDAVLIDQALTPYREHLKGVVVESTYNWYWLVDALQAKNYTVHLANTAAIQVYSGLKHTDDKTDAIWLAKLFRLNLLPEGHIYPKENRGLRELVRERLALVREQTRHILRIQNTVVRYENVYVSGDKIKNYPADDNDTTLIDYLHEPHVRVKVQQECRLLWCVMDAIATLEKAIIAELKPNEHYRRLCKMPGIGPILAMTILLETGNIERFAKVGNYSSYCRCVSSIRLSNEKKKGVNNRKNGNKYLAWAFIEAANFAIRYDASIKKYYQRKLAKNIRVVALNAVAHKLARAIYFVLRDKVEFDVTKSFS